MNDRMLVQRKKAHTTLTNPTLASPNRPTLAPIQSAGLQPITPIRTPNHLQAKLTVSQPGDAYEQEAERIAEQVMSMSSLRLQAQYERAERFGHNFSRVNVNANQPAIQPNVGSEVDRVELAPSTHHPIQHQDELEEDIQREAQEQPILLQPASDSTNVQSSSGDIESRLSNSKGGGSSLPNDVRSFMEPRFGANFEQVRIHTNSDAAQMNRDLGAHAFAHGRDIYFGAGKFNPSSSDGKRLLAHELTHVIQQDRGSSSVSTQPSSDYQHSELLAAPTNSVQATPTVTGITVDSELGVGRRLTARATVASGTPAKTALTWTLAGTPAGVTLTPRGQQATIEATPAASAAAGNVFQVQCALTATPGDNFTSSNITVVGITNVTFTATPAFIPIAALGGPYPFPPNTADPNRGGLTGNTAVVNAVTAPLGRPTTVTMHKSLGATATGNTITPGTTTGDAVVRVIDDATKAQRDETLTINPVPLNLNAFPAQAPLATPYGVLNTLRFASSDKTGLLDRIVGETITAGGRDDFGLTASVNGGPNPAPTLTLAVPANAWSDQLGTPTVVPAGAAPDANLMNVNRYVGPGVAAKLPRVWILRQGFHFMGWAGNFGREFDHGIHRRSLVQTGPNSFNFRSEHIFPKARAATFNEAYISPYAVPSPLIILSGFTSTPLVPAATRLAADGVATANVNVATTHPGRQIIWNVISGSTIASFTVPAVGTPAIVGTPATVKAGLVPGTVKVRVTDSAFPNRRTEGNIKVVPVVLRGMRALPGVVPKGTTAATVNLVADPGGRTVNWTVDAAAAAAGVSIAETAPAPATPARTATVTRPVGFSGRVKVTATDSVLPAKKASVTINFR